MTMASVSYTTLKSLISSKGLLWQYNESPTFYQIFSIEINTSWETVVLKDGGADQTDFETNYKSTANQTIWGHISAKLSDGSGTPVSLGQGLMAASLPVTIASNQTVISTEVNGAVTTASPTYGTGTVQPLSLDTSGNLRVTLAGGASSVVIGSKTNNNAAPGATNLGVLPAIANAATQTWTEGDLVLESVDLSGRQRVRGTLSSNSGAPDTDGLMALTAIANAAAPTFTEGDLVLNSIDLSGNQRITGNVSLGITTGKTVVMKTGTLVTTAVTADQVILTYTVTAGKTFFLQYFNTTCNLTAAPTNYNTPIIFGNISLENPSGTKLLTWRFIGPNIPQIDGWSATEPVPIAAGTVVRIVCTPGLTTSTTWVANFGGYER
jgi:hypothetical protein